MKSSIMFMMALVSCSLVAATAEQYTLGLATGYPPYQFTEGGQPAGLDIEIAGVLAKEGLNFTMIQDNWDDVVAMLRNRAGMDIVGGMEINAERQALDSIFGKWLKQPYAIPGSEQALPPAFPRERA